MTRRTVGVICSFDTTFNTANRITQYLFDGIQTLISADLRSQDFSETQNFINVNYNFSSVNQQTFFFLMGLTMYSPPMLHLSRTEDTKSSSSSSSSGSDQEESDAEADKESREDETAEQPKEADQEETVVPPHETDEPNPEEATESASAVAKDSDVQNSAGDSTEIDISDSSVPSGNENKQSDDTSGDNEVEKMVVESKQEEEQERGECVNQQILQLPAE